MTDIVVNGNSGPDDGAEISYPVGPSQVERIARRVAVPAALGVTSLVLAVASLMIMEPASEIGDAALFTRIGNSDGNLLALRWAAWLRSVVALIALALAIAAARALVGRRARVQVRVNAAEVDDPAALDALEKAAVEGQAVPATSQSAIIGAALVVAVLSFAFNAAAFAYAMSSHIPAQQNQPFGF